MFNRKIKLFTVCLIITIISFILSGCGESTEFKDEKREVQGYLKDKYGQEFTVQKTEYHSLHLGAEPHLWTYVISKDEKPIEFIVKEDGNDRSESNLFRGRQEYKSYQDLKWEQELDGLLKDLATKIFSRPSLLYTSLRTVESEIITNSSYFNAIKRNPDFFQNKTTDQLLYLVFFQKIKDKEKEAELINQFLNELRKLGMENFRVMVDYYSPEVVTEAKASIDKVGLKLFVSVEKGLLESSLYEKQYEILNEVLITKQEFDQKTTVNFNK